MDAAAARVTEVLAALRYDVIGSVETLFDGAAGFNFLEVNTRLQVEHAVTEAVTGVDLVVAQLRLAWGDRLDAVLPGPVNVSGHAVQARIYAEDPVRFFPSPGLLEALVLPQGPGIRVETGYAQGYRITPFYDPMIAKLIAHGSDRAQAIARLDSALAACVVRGVRTNIPFVRQVLASEEFRAGRGHTGLGAEVLREAAAQRAGAVAAPSPPST